MAGSAPVRRGIAVAAVVSGALSAAGAAVVTAPPAPHDPVDTDPSVIGLAAESKPVDNNVAQVIKELADDRAGERSGSGDEPKFDVDTLIKAINKIAEAQRSAATPGTGISGAVAAPAQGGAPGRTAEMPGQLIDPNDWYLTLPTGSGGSPDTIDGSKLATYHSQFFQLNQQRNGIVFSASADGATTKNSHYPRSELREMNGSQKASWSNTSGTHTLDLREAFTKLPDGKREVVGAQIHDDKDDVLQIRLEGTTLMVQYNDGRSEAVLDPNYQLGTPFDTRIVAADGKVDVLYNGQKKAELPLSGSGWYWKVGAYVQCNSSTGSGSGEVTVFNVNAEHTGGSGGSSSERSDTSSSSESSGSSKSSESPKSSESSKSSTSSDSSDSSKSSESRESRA